MKKNIGLIFLLTTASVFVDASYGLQTTPPPAVNKPISQDDLSEVAKIIVEFIAFQAFCNDETEYLYIVYGDNNEKTKPLIAAGAREFLSMMRQYLNQGDIHKKIKKVFDDVTSEQIAIMQNILEDNPRSREMFDIFARFVCIKMAQELTDIFDEMGSSFITYLIEQKGSGIEAYFGTQAHLFTNFNQSQLNRFLDQSAAISNPSAKDIENFRRGLSVALRINIYRDAFLQGAQKKLSAQKPGRNIKPKAKDERVLERAFELAQILMSQQ